MSAQYGELRPTNEIGSLVWGTPATFNGFRVFVLQRLRSLEANQTLHDVWPSPGLVYYISPYNLLGGSCPITELCKVQNSLCVQILRSPVLAALLHCIMATLVPLSPCHPHDLCRYHRCPSLRWASLCPSVRTSCTWRTRCFSSFRNFRYRKALLTA